MPYPYLKLIHIAGAILFVGNITVTALWKTAADRTGNPVIVAWSQRLVRVTDRAFTVPGILLLLGDGLVMALERGPLVYHSVWVMWGVTLLLASGVIWGVVLVPVQRRQLRLSLDFRAGREIPAGYWLLARRWRMFGMLATLLPWAALWLMVLRPAGG